MSLTGEVLLIWMSLNEGLIASPLNIRFCSINLITSDSLVCSTKFITAQPLQAAPLAQEQSQPWLQWSTISQGDFGSLTSSLMFASFWALQSCKQGLNLPGQGVWAAVNTHNIRQRASRKGDQSFPCAWYLVTHLLNVGTGLLPRSQQEKKSFVWRKCSKSPAPSYSLHNPLNCSAIKRVKCRLSWKQPGSKPAT